jgi:phospholipid/cholesterol/gamma-HCH transport system substrate-binding protein
MSTAKKLRIGSFVLALAIVAALGMGMAAPGGDGGAGGDTLVAYVTDASPLEEGSTVRAAGVKVGTVSSIRLEGDTARLEMDLADGVLPVHRDARLRIVPVNLLGEHYVELNPGSPDQPYQDGNVISKDRTESTVTLQDVINTFDDPTSTGLASLVTTLGEGLDDGGRQAADAIKALAPSMGRTKELGELLSAQNEVLGQLVKQAEPVASALADKDGQTMQRLVTSTERTLTTLAANRRAFDETLAELPSTLAAARRTLRELAGVSDATTPTLKSIRPVTDDLSAVTRELHGFADAADPALASLPAVLKRADKLLTQAAPVVRDLRKAGPDLRRTARSVRPLGDVVLNAHLGDLMDFVRKWALSTNERDAVSHYFRGVVHVTPKTLQDLAETLVPAGAPGPKPGGGLPSTGDLPLPDTDNLPLPKTKDLGSATGLSADQEQSLLGQLLGVN